MVLGGQNEWNYGENQISLELTRRMVMLSFPKSAICGWGKVVKQTKSKDFGRMVFVAVLDFVF